MSSLRRLKAITSHLSRPSPRTTFPTVKLGSTLSSSASPEMTSSVKEMVDQAIAQNDVVIFSKTWCQFCRRAKQILAQATDDKAKVIELDETDEESQIQAYLRQLNGQSTVPHIYIRQQFIGGSSDLQKLDNKELHKRIAAA